jgi:uncharacterized iron-regulated protein
VRDAPPSRIGVSDAVPEDEPASAAPQENPARDIPDDIVERSALPFQAQKNAGLVALAPQEYFAALARYDLICDGEEHDNPHDHWTQLYVVQELAERATSSGRELGLGLEMFQKRFQPALTDYAAEVLTATELLEKSQYHERWGYPFAFYRPQIDHAVQRGAGLLALNADRDLARAVAKEGLDALPEREARALGELDVDDATHRARFEELMKDHPDTGASLDNMYAAQVLWDETMASTAAKWLADRYPARQLVVLAGSAHCHESAIPSRVERRLQGAKVVSVKPIVRSAPIGEDISADTQQRLEGYDYGFLMGSD